MTCKRNQQKRKNMVVNLAKKVVHNIRMKLVNYHRGRVALGIVPTKLRLAEMRSAIAHSLLTELSPHELPLIMTSEVVYYRWINPVDCAENPSAVCQQHCYKELAQTLPAQPIELGMGASLIVSLRAIVRAFVLWFFG